MYKAEKLYNTIQQQWDSARTSRQPSEQIEQTDENSNIPNLSRRPTSPIFEVRFENTADVCEESESIVPNSLEMFLDVKTPFTTIANGTSYF